MIFINRRLLIGASSLLALGLTVEGCKKEEKRRLTPLDPPLLEFLGAENTAGDEFEPSDTQLHVSCDRLLTVHLGPSGEVSGTIANWSLRPPQVCSNLRQCGYVRVEALSESEEVLYVSDQAVASPLLVLTGVDLPNVASIRATLFDGETRAPFMIDEEQFSATWETEISMECDGLGGAGGGPSDPEDPEEPGEGGAGGTMGG